MADFKELTVKGQGLAAKLSAEESQYSPQTRHSPRANKKHLVGSIALALLPREGSPGEGKGQGMTPSSIPGLYKDSWGHLCNSQGTMIGEMPGCLVCFDAKYIKIDPRDIGRPSEGAWHWLKVPCPKWDKETKRCAV